MKLFIQLNFVGITSVLGHRQNDNSARWEETETVEEQILNILLISIGSTRLTDNTIRPAKGEIASN